jgi:hypothetical protein
MANAEPTPVPTREEIEAARQLVAEADARAAAEAAQAREAAVAPLRALLVSTEDARTTLAQLQRDFVNDEDVSLHLRAIAVGFNGLVQAVGYQSEATA